MDELYPTCSKAILADCSWFCTTCSGRLEQWDMPLIVHGSRSISVIVNFEGLISNRTFPPPLG